MATPGFLFGCWDTDSDPPLCTASPLPMEIPLESPAGPVLCSLLDERVPEFWTWIIWNCVGRYKLNELFIKAWDFPSLADWSLLFKWVLRSFSCIAYHQTNRQDKSQGGSEEGRALSSGWSHWVCLEWPWWRMEPNRKKKTLFLSSSYSTKTFFFNTLTYFSWKVTMSKKHRKDFLMFTEERTGAQRSQIICPSWTACIDGTDGIKSQVYLQCNCATFQPY